MTVETTGLVADPKEATDEEVREFALGWVNGLREEYGLPALPRLPRGTPMDPGGCVMARALPSDGTPVPCGGRYTFAGPPGATARFSHGGEVHTRQAPPLIYEFAARFDEGRYPDLVRTWWRR